LKKLALILPVLFLGCEDVTGIRTVKSVKSGKVALAPRVMDAQGADPAQVELVHVRLTIGVKDSVVMDTTYPWALKAVSLEVPVGQPYQLLLQGRNADDPKDVWRWSGAVKNTIDSTDETIWADTLFISQIKAPAFTAAAGTYQTSVNAGVSALAGDVLRFTTDGTDPTPLSAELTSTTSVKTTSWLRVRAFRTLAGGVVLASQAAEGLFTITDKAVPQAPSLSINGSMIDGGSFVVPTEVSIAAPAGAVAEYSRDGFSFSPVSMGKDTIRYSQTLLVRSSASNGSGVISPARAVTFHVAPANVTPAVTFSELGGTYRTSRLVGMNCAKPGASIQYSWDGVNWMDYVAPVLVSEKKTLVTLRARAKAGDLLYSSPISSVSFYIEP
jgi:hypothetical protein